MTSMEIGLCSVCGGVVYSGTLYEIEKGEFVCEDCVLAELLGELAVVCPVE